MSEHLWMRILWCAPTFPGVALCIVQTPFMLCQHCIVFHVNYSLDTLADQMDNRARLTKCSDNPGLLLSQLDAINRLYSCAGQAKDAFTFAHQLQRDTHLYRVSDIFASDFAFNKFDPDAEMMPASAPARRLFHAEHARDSGLQAGSALLHDLMGAAK